MKHLPDFLRGSMTYDRDSEMAEHAIMPKALMIDIILQARMNHSSWEIMKTRMI